MLSLASDVNAIYATNVALHLWSISGPRPSKTAEIRHFLSGNGTKTVQVE
jgi:hypothetical protein